MQHTSVSATHLEPHFCGVGLAQPMEPDEAGSEGEGPDGVGPVGVGSEGEGPDGMGPSGPLGVGAKVGKYDGSFDGEIMAVYVMTTEPLPRDVAILHKGVPI